MNRSCCGSVCIGLRSYQRRGASYCSKSALSSQAGSDAADADGGSFQPPAYLQWDRDHVIHPYSSMTNPLSVYPVRSAKGVHITLEDNRELIDGMSSWWAAVHGYRHPVMDEAIRRQLQESMSHVMFGGMTHRPAATLGKRLVEMTPLELTKVFLCDSGSVSVEVALKMAIQYWHNQQQQGSVETKKTKFISLINGYHGDTFGAMSVCDPINGMHSLFSGVLAEQFFVESPRGHTREQAMDCIQKVTKMLEEKQDHVAGIILEPIVQGAGGMRFYHPVLLQELRRLCDSYDTLLIFDEIATAFGRTGTLFACQHTDRTYNPWYSSSLTPLQRKRDAGCDGSAVAVVPDIMCVGKALTGGYMTLGATLTTERIAQGISQNGGVFMHGPTFMGNPLACSAALASLDLLTSSPWQDRIQSVEESLISSLAPAADLESVHEVRVLGGIGVCELKEPIKDTAKVQKECVDRGVWLRPFGKLLYTMPTFNCPDLTEDHVSKIGQTICEVAATVETS